MKLLSPLLRIIVGTVFILSGLAKLYPIEPFEIIFVDLGVSNWVIAPFFARSVIAFELFFGLCIIFNTWFKKSIYYATQTSLVLFTIYLIFLLITKGNSVDCGCFGSFLSLTPIQSIIKNVLMISILVFIKKQDYQNLLKWFPLPFLIIAFTIPFLLNKVGLQNVQGKELNQTINLSGLPNLYGSDKNIDFQSGDKIIAFLSVKCSHCKSVAHKLAYLNQKEKANNLFLIIAAKHEEDLHSFIEETQLEVPFIWMDDDTFFKYSGGRLPAFIYVKDGILKKKWTGEFFKVEELNALIESDF